MSFNGSPSIVPFTNPGSNDVDFGRRARTRDPPIISLTSGTSSTMTSLLGSNESLYKGLAPVPQAEDILVLGNKGEIIRNF